MAKRQCRHAGDYPNLPLPAARSSQACRLLPLLQPVRYCQHAFLGDVTAALMRTSRSVKGMLLRGYNIAEHVFTPDAAAELKSTIAFYGRYHVRIHRLCLPAEWKEALIDGDSGLTELPASLIALTLGGQSGLADGQLVRASPMPPSMAARAQCAQRGVMVCIGGGDAGRSEFQRRIQLVDTDSEHDHTWDVLQYDYSEGALNVPIPSGALPCELRFLQFCDKYDQPLSEGSITDGVEVVQFESWFNQPLSLGHLPASLTYLLFDSFCDRPFLPGVLPAGLRRLRLGHGYHCCSPGWTLIPSHGYNQPLMPGALPSRLEQSSLGHAFYQPLVAGAIPSSVTHLRLGK